MVNLNQIFKAYDIRGTYPDQLNAETFYLLGRAYTEFIKREQIPVVVIGRDARPSSFELFKALTAGIEEQKGQVVNIGESTTPLLYFAVNHFKADGGLMITASHNPPGYNGLKVTGEKAIPISGETGFERIKELMTESDWGTDDLQEKMSRIQPDTREAKQEYLRSVIEKIDFDRKIAIDCGNGMAGILVKPLLNELEIDYEILYSEPDCTFPNHEANPLKEETLRDLKKLMREENIDFGIAFDGDADRVAFLDENQNLVGGDYITALLARERLNESRGPVVYDLRSSKIVPEVISDNGGEPIKSRVGHSLIKQTMRDEDAVFAGELSSHFYYPFEIKNHKAYFESPLSAVIQVLKKMTDSGETLGKLIEPLKKYYQSGEINFEIDNKGETMKRIERHYQEANEILHLDGVSVEFDNWWFNLRPSNTEPLLRLNLEADTKKLMKEKTQEVRALINS